MTAETTAEPPTLGEIYWDGYVAKAGIVNVPYTDLDQEAIDGIEAGAAAAGAAAIERKAQQEPDMPGRPTTSLEDAMLANIDGLNDLVRDMLQSFPDTADEQEWRDRAGTLDVHDPDGHPYRAYTEDDL